MLNRLEISHFTVFKEARFEFCRGLNVLIGDNGTGKTHVLKLGYLFSKAWPGLMQHKLGLSEQRAASYMEERLAGLFRTGDLANLIAKGHKNGAAISAEVTGHIPTVRIHMPGEQALPGAEESMPWALRLKRGKDERVSVEAPTVPDAAAANSQVLRPVFVPSKEIVSLFKGLIGLFEAYREFPLDETYRDLAASMATLEPLQPSSLMPLLAEQISGVLGGALKLVKGDLVFERIDGSRLESQLLAEGHRKLALLIYLVHHRLIESGSTLFWDEPEANLNPAAVRLLAEALHALVVGGVQVILATHSLFLLREFEILARKSGDGGAPHRYFALGRSKKGVTVSVGSGVESIEPLVLLDEDLSQSDRFLGVVQ